MPRGQVLVPNADPEAEAGAHRPPRKRLQTVRGSRERRTGRVPPKGGVTMQVPGVAMVAPEALSLLEGGSLQGPSLLSGQACPAVGWKDRVA